MRRESAKLGRVESVRAELVDLMRDYSVESQHLVDTFAQRHGLHSTDLRALLAVLNAERAGDPLTPGRLGEALGLSSGATTAVVDRLERAGHLRRTRESADRRVVHLRYGEAGQRLASTYFRSIGARSHAVMDGFSADELDVVRRFLRSMNDALADVRSSS